MSTTRRLLLTALPKVPLSRLTGLATSTPLPRLLRARLYSWFARRYGASLEEVEAELSSYPSLQAFFQRALRAGARPVSDAPLVWPCDGRIVTAGPIEGARVPQVKGHDYSLSDLLGDAGLAATLAGGQQATIYLAPGDYHRVHSPVDAELLSVTPLRGTLFPVNPGAVRCNDQLFVRNSRHVFSFQTASGGAAALVMVGAYNVGHTSVTRSAGRIDRGEEIGRFGFGSTVVLVLGPGAPPIQALSPESKVQMGGAAAPGAI